MQGKLIIVLNIIRSIMNWYAARHDDYVPVIMRGMRRHNPKAQARTRVLDDQEIRDIWKAAELPGHSVPSSALHC